VAYVTPQSSPPAGTCREISIPNDERMIAAVLGQILELTEIKNWEQTDGISVIDTVAAWQTVFDSFAAQDPCSGGGGGDVDYKLQDEIELLVDTTTVTLSSLDLLTGRDLLIEVFGQNSAGGRRDLRLRVNGLSTNIYDSLRTRFGTATEYASSTENECRFDVALPSRSAHPNTWGFARIHFPKWKLTDRFPMINANFNGDSRQGLVSCHVESVGKVESVELFSSGADLTTGTHIAVYTRGT